MYHYANWKLWGDYRDFCAYKMLLGDVKSPEFKRAQGTIRGIKGAQKLREIGLLSYEKCRERGELGNRVQRERLEKQGRTIAEKCWEVVSPEGEVFTITNIKKFCRDKNLSPSHMSSVSTGRRKQHKGWRCRKLS